MGDGPLELFHSNEDLAKLSIYHRLARVHARDATDFLRIVQDILLQTPEHRTTLLKRRSPPLLLRLLRGGDRPVDAIVRSRVDQPKEIAGSRCVALHRRGAGDFDAGVGDEGVGLGEFRRWDCVLARTVRGGLGGGVGETYEYEREEESDYRRNDLYHGESE